MTAVEVPATDPVAGHTTRVRRVPSGWQATCECGWQPSPDNYRIVADAMALAHTERFPHA